MAGRRREGAHRVSAIYGRFAAGLSGLAWRYDGYVRPRGVALACVLAVAACGGETEVGPSPSAAADSDPAKDNAPRPRVRSEEAAPPSDPTKPSRTPAEWARILCGDNSSDEQRGEAADALVALGAGAVPFLVDALEDDDALGFALDALRRLGVNGVAAAPALLDRIRRGKFEADVPVLAAFGPAVIPAIEKALAGSDAPVRNAAVNVLALLAWNAGRVQDADTARRIGDVVGPLTSDGDPWVRISALTALSHVWSSRSDTGALLVAALSDEKQWVRNSAAQCLARCPGDATAIVPALVRALDDADPGVGFAAARALRALGDRAGDARVAVLEFLRRHPTLNISGTAEIGIDPLQTALASSDPAIRRLAAQTLAGMGARASDAAASLTKAIDDPSPDVRASALDALAAAGPPADAAPKLRDAVAAPEPAVRAAAARAMGRLTAPGDDVVGDLLKCLTDPVGDVRAEAAIAIGRLASDAARCVPALVVLLDDADLRARASAAQAIGAFGTAARDAASDLRRSLAHGDPWVRLGAAMSLARVEPRAPEPWETFGRLVLDANRDVRRRTVLSLGVLRREEAVPLLTERLDDRDADVRKAAAQALGDMGPAAAAAIPSLEAMTKARYQGVADAARAALAAIRAK
jgi:HEAT repeat protein